MAEKQPTLTELAENNRILSAALQEHTEARNYLFSVFSGEVTVPHIAVGGGTPVNRATIDMKKLPQDVIEQILIMMIEHEEKTTFSLWADIALNAKNACETITKIRNAQNEELKRQIATVEEEKKMIIPFKSRQQAPPPDDEAEVPTGWPGKK